MDTYDPGIVIGMKKLVWLGIGSVAVATAVALPSQLGWSMGTPPFDADL